VLHGIYFVIAFPAVVTGHQQFRGSAQLVEFHAPTQAVMKHITGASVGMDAATKDQDAIHIRKIGGFFQREDLIPGSSFYKGIDAEQGTDAKDAQAHKDAKYTEHDFLFIFHRFTI
jgi:hypothetical protein